MLIAELAGAIIRRSPQRVRVAIDGYTAAGKTTLGNELAAAIRASGRSTARASLDDFKHPWRHSVQHGYDRVSGEGYYRNAYDFTAARELLLQPAAADGSGLVALCAWDPLTGVDHRETRVQLTPDCVLIVDSVFAFRPEYNAFWDYRIWVHVSPDLALRRGVARDAAREGLHEATELHQSRYQVAESIYAAEIDPQALADVIVDNSDYSAPRLRIQHD